MSKVGPSFRTRVSGARRVVLPRFAAPLLASLLLGACGTPTLGRAPPAPIDIAGEWVLDRAASDDAQAIVAAALPKPRHPRGHGPAGPPDKGEMEARDFLREYVVPAERLELRPGAADTYTVVQGARRRTHELGTESPPSVTDRYGSRVVRAGWDGRALVVTSDGGREVRLAETFRAGPAPDTLAYHVALRAQGLKKIDIDALYRRAPAAPAPRAAPEGPPAPQR